MTPPTGVFTIVVAVSFLCMAQIRESTGGTPTTMGTASGEESTDNSSGNSPEASTMGTQSGEESTDSSSGSSPEASTMETSSGEKSTDSSSGSSPEASSMGTQSGVTVSNMPDCRWRIKRQVCPCDGRIDKMEWSNTTWLSDISAGHCGKKTQWNCSIDSQKFWTKDRQMWMNLSHLGGNISDDVFVIRKIMDCTRWSLQWEVSPNISRLGGLGIHLNITCNRYNSSAVGAELLTNTGCLLFRTKKYNETDCKLDVNTPSSGEVTTPPVPTANTQGQGPTTPRDPGLPDDGIPDNSWNDRHNNNGNGKHNNNGNDRNDNSGNGTHDNNGNGRHDNNGNGTHDNNGNGRNDNNGNGRNDNNGNGTHDNNGNGRNDNNGNGRNDNNGNGRHDNAGTPGRNPKNRSVITPCNCTHEKGRSCMARCTSKRVQQLENLLNKRANPVDIISGLAEILVEAEENISGDHVIRGIGLLRRLVSRLNNESQQITREQAVNFTKAMITCGSALLKKHTDASWKNISEDRWSEVASGIVDSSERAAILLARTVPNEAHWISEENIVMTIKNGSTETATFPDLGNSPVWAEVDDGITLPRTEHHVISAIYSKIGQYLKPKSVNRTVNSRIISATLVNATLVNGNSTAAPSVDGNVTIVLEHTDETINNSIATCVFWDVSHGNWSDEGCTVATTNATHTICECNHLTSFAILVDTTGQHITIDRQHSFALDVITYIGCVISIVCLFICICVFLGFR